jgi:uncharacterized protein (TIGR00255 family)
MRIMVNSMTGFGRAISQKEGRELTIELKSVNHRYLDLGMRLPRSLSYLEDVIRSVLQKKLARGHVDVFLTYKNTRTDSKSVEVDAALLSAYKKAAAAGAEQTGMLNDLSLTTLLRMPDVLSVCEAEEDREALADLCGICTEQACGELIRMRRTEGAQIAQDLLSRADLLLEMVGKIEERAPLVVSEYKEKLHTRIAELLAGAAEVDQGRLANEVAIFADKANITEELVRLRSHVAQFRSLMQSDQPAGRKLDFIVQEMNREMNTIGSKASDLEILKNVIDGKAEIEKIREQVQNIE